MCRSTGDWNVVLLSLLDGSDCNIVAMHGLDCFCRTEDCLGQKRAALHGE